MILINPAFVLIVVIVCIAVWFLASALYKPIGKFICKIGKDTIDIMNEIDESDKTKQNNEK